MKERLPDKCPQCDQRIESMLIKAREVRSRAYSRAEQYRSGGEYTYDGQIMLDAGDVINDLICALTATNQESSGRTV